MRVVKVCHLITSGLSNHGPSNVVVSIVGQAVGRPFEMSVWSLYPPPVGRDPLEGLRMVGAECRHFRMRSVLDVRVLGPLVRQLRSLQPDILHCHLVRANLYGRVAGRLAHVPSTICTHHGIEDYTLGSHWSDRVARTAERLTEPWVTRHVGVSESVRQGTIRRLKTRPEKVMAIPNGVDLAKYRSRPEERLVARTALSLPADAVVVGTVGALNATKDLQVLVRLVPRLVNRWPNLRFAIIGEGDQRPALAAMIRTLGMDRFVAMPGFRADVPQLLQALDVFVSTSRSEGFGLAVAEAMASSLPCVTFDAGGLGEVMANGETGFVVRPGDADAFEAALNQLIESVNLRRSMGQAARDRVQVLFSAELMTQRYCDLYAELAAV